MIKKKWFSSLLFIFFLTQFAQASKPVICTLTMNSNDEKKIFQSYYKNEFDFNELTETYGKKNDDNDEDEQSNEDWFHNACADQNLVCDVVVLSGHFGGIFDGDYDGPELSLETLRNYAVDGTCNNILQKSKEVYLFGCNTLAKKYKQNSRSRFKTFGSYYQHLINEDYAAPSARFIAESKYYPIGFSIREQMQMIFTGPKIIYGFYDSAPLGRDVSPILKKFLKKREEEGSLTADSLAIQTHQIETKKSSGAYWGKVFKKIVGKRAHADFGVAFDEIDKDGNNLMETRNLNWSYRMIPFNPNSSSDENWAPLFESINAQMKSAYALEVAPEVIYFFNRQLGPYLANHQPTPYIEEQLALQQSDPDIQFFLEELTRITENPQNSRKFPSVVKSIKKLFRFFPDSLPENKIEKLF
jgi:hypothetical protein